jgi:hypothetical protein
MRPLPLAIALLFAACAGEVAPGAPPDAGGPAEDGPTYYRDVYPILQARCAGCHTDGGIAPFSLDEEPEAARAAAGVIALETEAGRMPPFLPGPLSPPLREDNRLGDDEIATLGAWAAAGAPLGDVADKPAPPEAPVFPFSDADVVADIGVDYTPPTETSSGDPLADEYRCFAVPVDLPADRYAVAYRIVPGDARVVHHVILSLVDGADADALAALDAETEAPGWPCFGGAIPAGVEANRIGGIGAWTPGQNGRVAFPGTGIPIPGGAIAVASIHYNTASGTAPDRTGFELYLAPESEQAGLARLADVRVASQDIVIPAGAADVRIERTRAAIDWTGGLFYPDREALIVGAGAHAHLLLTRHRITLNRGTPGERILLDIPRWDFHWQGGWTFVEPIPLAPDDTITIECTYDNSAAHRAELGLDPAPVEVRFGEGTADEMCIGPLAVVDDLP